MNAAIESEEYLALSPELGPTIALDTSDISAQLSIYHPDQKKVYTTICPESAKPSESILLSIQACLKASSLKLDELNSMLIGLGPGSFTGLRVGLATMKGLALGTNTPLYGFSSMEAHALSLNEEYTLVIRNSQRGDIFAGLFGKTKESAELNKIIPVALFQPESLKNKLFAIDAKQIHVVGDQVETIMGQLKQDTRYIFNEVKMHTKNAFLLSQNDVLQSNHKPLEELSPAYLRRSAAEENAKLN